MLVDSWIESSKLNGSNIFFSAAYPDPGQGAAVKQRGQFFRDDTEVFPSRPRDLISLEGLGSAPRFPPNWIFLKHFIWKGSRRHPYQMPEPS